MHQAVLVVLNQGGLIDGPEVMNKRAGKDLDEELLQSIRAA